MGLVLGFLCWEIVKKVILLEVLLGILIGVILSFGWIFGEVAVLIYIVG